MSSFASRRKKVDTRIGKSKKLMETYLSQLEEGKDYNNYQTLLQLRDIVEKEIDVCIKSLPTHLPKLPKDVLISIFSFLAFRDIYHVSTVCRLFYQLIFSKDSYFMKNRFKIMFPSLSSVNSVKNFVSHSETNPFVEFIKMRIRNGNRVVRDDKVSYFFNNTNEKSFKLLKGLEKCKEEYENIKRFSDRFFITLKTVSEYDDPFDGCMSQTLRMEGVIICYKQHNESSNSVIKFSYRHDIYYACNEDNYPRLKSEFACFKETKKEGEKPGGKEELLKIENLLELFNLEIAFLETPLRDNPDLYQNWKDDIIKNLSTFRELVGLKEEEMRISTLYQFLVFCIAMEGYKFNFEDKVDQIMKIL